jgi:CMP/dCMP kinase
MQRALADSLGMTTLELNKYSESHPEIDQQIDGELVRLGAEGVATVFDSRLAWKMVPTAFKVHLLVDLEVAAQRVTADQSRSSESYTTLAEAQEKLLARRRSEISRFKEMYGIDCSDLSHYDLVIDTSDVPPDVVGELILAGLAGRVRSPRGGLWASPRTFLPTARAAQVVDLEWVEIRLDDGLRWLVSGQARVAAALAAGTPLMAVSVGADSGSDLDASEPSAAEVLGWESAHGFRFRRLPAGVVRQG